MTKINNTSIANKLGNLYQEISVIEKQNTVSAITDIQKSLYKIDDIAQENQAPILRAIIHWMSLNTELDENNHSEIEELISNDSYSNWIDVLSTLLFNNDFDQLPVLHQCLTSQNWIIRPSPLLLKGIASWLNEIQQKLNEDSKDTEISQTLITNENINNFENITTSIDTDINSLINNQIQKAEIANNEILDHHNVFEKFERETLDHEYEPADEVNEEFKEKQSLNVTSKTSINNQDLLIDEELFSQNDSLVESYIEEEEERERITNETVITNGFSKQKSDEISEVDSSELISLDNDLLEIYQHLKAKSDYSHDLHLAKDNYNKYLDRLAILSSGSAIEFLSNITDWCQSNLILFETNPSEEINSFIQSGNAWSWIRELHHCFNNTDKHDCLSKLTNSLTHKEWLEPIDSKVLENFLLNVNNILSNENSIEEKIDVKQVTKTENSNVFENIKTTKFIEIPQLIEEDVIETAHNENNDEKTNYQFTWDDSTHPELLIVYLEETPRHISELVPLLKNIGINETNKEDLIKASRLAHTIKGGSAIVGITALSEFCSKLETILDHLKDHTFDNSILDLLPKAANYLEEIFDAVQFQRNEPSEFSSILEDLDSYALNIESQDTPLNISTSTELPSFIIEQNITKEIETPEIDTNLIEVDLAEQKVEIIETTNQAPENNLIDDQINTDQLNSSDECSNFQMNWNDDTHPELLMVYLEETPTQINTLIPLLEKISNGTADADEKHIASRMAHTIKGGSALVGITVLSEISYRLETLLDHSVKHQLPNEILNLLPKTSTCLENIFEAIQMQDDEPAEYFSIFKKLDEFVASIDEDSAVESLELVTPLLPDFILNQNEKSEDTNQSIDSDKNDDVTTQSNSLDEIITDNLNTSDSFDSPVDDSILEDDVTEVTETSDQIESITVEITKLEKLEDEEDVSDITNEMNDIVMNLILIGSQSKDLKKDSGIYSSELQRFDLLTEISGYPELSLISQWCQANIKLASEEQHEKFNLFIESGETWSWIEHVAAVLNDPNDMSHLSSLSVELMRDDWVKAINMDDLQTVLLALRNYDSVDVTNDAEYITETNDGVDEDISWDKDIHPELLAVYFNETPDQISEVAEILQKISKGESTTEENKKAARIAHTIKGASGVVGLNSLLELTHSLEDILDYSVSNRISKDTANLLAEASDCMESLFEAIQNKKEAPEDLQSILTKLSAFSPSSMEDNNLQNQSSRDNDVVEEQKLSIQKLSSAVSSDALANKQKSTADVDINEAHVRVPIRIIDKLLNLAGELVTTSSQVSDDLNNSLATNKSIKAQDDRVNNMLEELSNTITQQEKDQHKLLASFENSEFDSLEMDSYNELHSVASLLTESFMDSQEIDNTLTSQLNGLSDKLRSLDKLNKEFSDVILRSRMISVNTIIPRLERIVRQTCRKTNKKANLKVTGNNIHIDTEILNGLIDPLLHMLRNSIDHGIESPEERIENNKDETGLIELSFTRDGNNILMGLKDDGAGIDPEAIYQKAIDKNLITPDQEFTKKETLELILKAGFSTQENVTDISGRGVGMDVVNTSVKNLNGSMKIDSKVGRGSTFNLSIPLTLITNNTLLVEAADNIVALPIDTIEQIIYQEANNVIERDGIHYVLFEGNELEIKSLGHLLEWSKQAIDFSHSCNILIIKSQNAYQAIQVDNIISSREVVVKTLSPWIDSTRGVVGACHLNNGGVAPVINLITIVKQSKFNKRTTSIDKVIATTQSKKQTRKILVVDDSLSNRKALSLIIDKTEYDVITAVDGMDALQIMNENSIDLVFTDLEMPRMNGIELTQAIRAWTSKSKTPIVMITSRTTKKHRELATKAGVDDYLTKPVVTDTLLDSINTWLVPKEALEA